MPTGFTPIYKIVKGGIDITDHFNDRTLEIQVTLKGGGGDADTCKITVDDRDWRVARVDVGAKLEVFLGYQEVGLAQQGIFEVDTVDYVINPKQIEIVGNSVGFEGAIKTPAVRDFENKSLGDIIRSIGQAKGAETYISPDLDKVKLPFVNQTSSPIHLLHELERRFGALAKFENGRLIFVGRDEGETAGGIEMPVLLLRPEHLNKGLVRHTRRSDFDGVRVGWFDQDHVKQYHTEKDPNASQETDGEDQGDYFLSKQLGRNEDEARFMAKSQMAALKRVAGEAHLTLAKGNPWIRDQMRIALRDFRDGVNGGYVTDTVTHTYTKEPGISTEILAKPPGTGESFDSLEESAFVALGTDGVVAVPDVIGPQQPREVPGFVPPADAGDASTSPVEIETAAVNL